MTVAATRVAGTAGYLLCAEVADVLNSRKDVRLTARPTQRISGTIIVQPTVLT